MTTLTEFLLERIAEDEAVAEAARALQDHGSDRWWVDGPAEKSGKWWVYATGEKFHHQATADHIARHDPARVLAECEAKRRIVERHARCGSGMGYCDDGGHGWENVDSEKQGCADLADLATPYFDHPNFRVEWR